MCGAHRPQNHSTHVGPFRWKESSEQNKKTLEISLANRMVQIREHILNNPRVP